MAKFIILFFMVTGSGVTYLTYHGIGQEKLETVKQERDIRSNSYRTRGSIYNSSGYSYGK